MIIYSDLKSFGQANNIFVNNIIGYELALKNKGGLEYFFTELIAHSVFKMSVVQGPLVDYAHILSARIVHN